MSFKEKFFDLFSSIFENRYYKITSFLAIIILPILWQNVEKNHGNCIILSIATIPFLISQYYHISKRANSQVHPDEKSFYITCESFMCGIIQGINEIFRFGDNERISVYIKIGKTYKCLFRYSSNPVYNLHEYKKSYSSAVSCVHDKATTTSNGWIEIRATQEEEEILKNIDNDSRRLNKTYLNMLKNMFSYNRRDIKNMWMRSAWYAAHNFSLKRNNKVVIQGALVIESINPSFYKNIKLKDIQNTLKIITSKFDFWLINSKGHYEYFSKVSEDAVIEEIVDAS